MLKRDIRAYEATNLILIGIQEHLVSQQSLLYMLCILCLVNALCWQAHRQSTYFVQLFCRIHKLERQDPDNIA